MLVVPVYAEVSHRRAGSLPRWRPVPVVGPTVRPYAIEKQGDVGPASEQENIWSVLPKDGRVMGTGKIIFVEKPAV